MKNTIKEIRVDCKRHKNLTEIRYFVCNQNKPKLENLLKYFLFSPDKTWWCYWCHILLNLQFSAKKSKDLCVSSVRIYNISQENNNLTLGEECLYTLGEVERKLVELVVSGTLHRHLYLFVLFKLEQISIKSIYLMN